MFITHKAFVVFVCTASSMAQTTALSRIRSSLLSQTLKLEPGMLGLRTAMQLLFVVITVMSIVGYAVIQQSVHSLDASIRDISAAADLRNGMGGLRKTALHLTMIARGLIDPSWEAVERRNLLTQVHDLSHRNEELYLRMPELTTALQNLYTKPSVTTDVVINERSVQVKEETLWQAMNGMISHSLLLHEVPLSDMRDTEAHVFVSNRSALHDLPPLFPRLT